MASDRAIAQAFRECDGMEFVDAAGRSSLNWIAKRAERIDATPPAGAGEAVATERTLRLHHLDSTWPGGITAAELREFAEDLTTVGTSAYMAGEKVSKADAIHVREMGRTVCSQVALLLIDIADKLDAAPTPLPEAVRELVEAVEELLQSHPAAQTYPDGPCIERQTRADLKRTLAALRAIGGES